MSDTNVSTLRSFVGRLRTAHVRGVARLVAIRTLWLALAGIGALLAADAMFPLPDTVREGLRWAFLAALAAAAAATWIRASRASSPERHVLRRIESGDGRLQNDLINALEFGDRLESAPHETTVTASLMRRAVQRAVDEIKTIRDWSPLKPPSLPRERNMLVLAAVLTFVALLVCGDVFRAVVPRYLAPFGDNPPYSPTHIRVEPGAVRIDYGSQIAVKAQTTGVVAREAKLVMEDATGHPLQTLPMFQVDNGHFAQTIENVRQPMRYYVEVPNGRSRRYALTLDNTPRIKAVGLRLTPPAYTHKPLVERQLDQPLFKGYTKSHARLTFVSNRPLAGGELRLQLPGGAQTVALRPEGENAASGEFDLSEPCSLTAVVTDETGQARSVEWNGSVEILADEKPTISITSPGMDSFAIPDIEVPIVVEANDDLGLRNVTLIREINGSRDFVKVLTESDGTEGFLHAVENLNMADLGVEGGDIITYYATTTDTDPNNPHTAATPAFQLAVISFDDYRKYMQTNMTANDLAAKYDEYRERMDQLAKEQEALRKETEAVESKAEWEKGLSKSDRETLAEKQRRQEDLARQTSELAEDMRREAAKSPIFDVEKDFKRDMQKIADRMDAAAKNMQSAQKSMGEAGAAGQLAGAQNALQQGIQSQKEAANGLRGGSQEYAEGIGQSSQELKDAMDMIGDVEQFKDLYRRQKELERQARLFDREGAPSRDDRTRMKELADEQAQIRKELDELVPKLRSHAEAAQKSQPKAAQDAQKIADEIERRAISGSMQQGQEKLGQADGQSGHSSAAEALEQMAAMISFCEGTMGQSGQCEMRLKIQMSSRNMSMGSTLNQLRAGLSAGRGRMGLGGELGSGGAYGSATPFGVFGGEKFGKPTRESRVVGPRERGKAVAAAEGAASTAVVEELAANTASGRDVKYRGGDRTMEEYRTLIEAYFRGLAEQK